ncbi:MAG: tRNA-dihydrouridine synthase [Candidatus Latescibacterota bacterium]
MVDRTLRIGPLCVSPGILLAPMEDVTELPFRLLCRRLGADIVYTEFVSAEGLVRAAPGAAGRILRKVEICAAERPVGVQLYGASGASMERATDLAMQQDPDLLDVNCGCWVTNVALRGAGAGLLLDLGAMRQVVARVVRSAYVPVTVKTRLGWDAGSIRIVEVARMLEDLGVQALTIHCRTRAQGYAGEADHSWIPVVKAAVSIPVILNGDVTTAQQVRQAFAATGCDGVMIGRGAIKHPWVFREARQLLLCGVELPPPTLGERVDLCLEHLRLATEHGGPHHALISLRRHYSGYFRGVRRGAHLRAALAGIGDVGVLRERLLELRDAPQAADAPAVA